MKRISILLAAMTTLFMLGMVVVGQPAAYAQGADAKKQVCEGIGLASGTKGCAEPKNSPTVSSVLKTVINLLSTIVGVAAVIAIIYGGFRYIVAGGDSSKISTAKDTIMYAVIGLIIVAMAQAIVRFVLNKL